MPTGDLATFDGHKNPDGTFDATVYLNGRPCDDPDLILTRATEAAVQKLWYAVKARWPEIHLGSGLLECVTRGVDDKNIDGL